MSDRDLIERATDAYLAIAIPAHKYYMDHRSKDAVRALDLYLKDLERARAAQDAVLAGERK